VDAKNQKRHKIDIIFLLEQFLTGFVCFKT